MDGSVGRALRREAGSPGGRSFRAARIAFAFARFGTDALRLRRDAPAALAERLCATLEGLGTTFVKLGQGLSLRRDVLPEPYRVALERLQNRVPPFDPRLSLDAVERAFGAPVDALFAQFEREPFAAASVAQVHRATLHDGTPVAVKVRRPGVARQVEQDIRLLRRMARVASWVLPAVRRQKPLALIDELALELAHEIDLAHEARNARRLGRAVAEIPGVAMPRVIEPYAAHDVLVETFSAGHPIATEFGTAAGQALATRLLDAYLVQLADAGVFHGDPHPGNLHVLDDGTLCLHDFGTVGYLDPAARRALAQLVEAVAYADGESVLAAALALGFVTPPIDRREYLFAISEILEELQTLLIAEWSLAETLWRIAKLGRGEHFRLPRHLLVLLRTLFLLENTIRALDPGFDLLAELRQREATIAALVTRTSVAKRPLAQRVTRTATAIPVLIHDMIRQAQSEEGRIGLSMHHRGLEELELHLGRTGNRLSLALVTLGLYIAGSLLMLHSAGPRVLDDVPLFALVAYGIALLLSLELVFAIRRSGRL